MTTLDPFTYFTVVPSDTQQEWRLRFEGGVSGATPFTHEPSLSIADADPPAHSNADRPWVLRSRLTLRGGGREASFHLDRSLTSELRVGGERFVFFRNNGGIHGIHVFVKHGFYTGPRARRLIRGGRPLSHRLASSASRFGNSGALKGKSGRNRAQNHARRMSASHWPESVSAPGTRPLRRRICWRPMVSRWSVSVHRENPGSDDGGAAAKKRRY